MSSIMSLTIEEWGQILEYLDVWAIANLISCGAPSLSKKLLSSNAIRLLSYHNVCTRHVARLPLCIKDLKGVKSIQLQLHSNLSYVEPEAFYTLPLSESLEHLELEYDAAALHLKEWINKGNRLPNLRSLSLISMHPYGDVWEFDMFSHLGDSLQSLKLEVETDSEVEKALFFLPTGIEHLDLSWPDFQTVPDISMSVDWILRLNELKSLKLNGVADMTTTVNEFSFPTTLVSLNIPLFSRMGVISNGSSTIDWKSSDQFAAMLVGSLKWIALPDSASIGPNAPFWSSLLHFEVTHNFNPPFLDDTLVFPPNCTSLVYPSPFIFQNLPQGLKTLICGIDEIGMLGFPDSPTPDWIQTICEIPSSVTCLHLPVSLLLPEILKIGLPSSLTYLKAGAVWGVGPTATSFPSYLQSLSHLFPSPLRFLETEYDFFVRLSDQELLQIGLDTSNTLDHWISLHLAAKLDHVPLLEYLLYQVGHKIIKNQFDAGYALKSACRHGSMKVLEYLEKRRLVCHFQLSDHENCPLTERSIPSCLTEALQSPQYQRTCEWLIRRGFTFCYDDGPVYDYLDELEKLEWLSDHGLNLHKDNGTGTTPLVHAISKMNEPASRFLFNHYLKSINYHPHASQYHHSPSSNDISRAAEQFHATHPINYALTRAFNDDPTIIEFMHKIDPTHIFINPAETYNRILKRGFLPPRLPYVQEVVQKLHNLYKQEMKS